MSGIPDDRGIGLASKKDSIAKAIALSANKLTSTINTYKRDCRDGTHDFAKVSKTDLEVFN